MAEAAVITQPIDTKQTDHIDVELSENDSDLQPKNHSEVSSYCLCLSFMLDKSVKNEIYITG